ncbi:MAG: HAD family hydrolase [Bacteroidota bacterium]
MSTASNKPYSEVLVIDVCDTLFKSNTTFDFVDYLLGNTNRLRHQFFLLITSRLSPAFYTLELLGKVTGIDVIRRLVIFLLRGYPKNMVEQWATDFMEDFLMPRLNTEVLQILQHRKSSKRFLISSSVEPVVKAIAHRLNVGYYASGLEERNGVITGRMSMDLTGKKHHVVEAINLTTPIHQLVVVTDNKSDYRLVEMAQERFVVVYSEEKKNFWRPLNPKFILLD